MHVYFRLERDEDGYPPFADEEVDAEQAPDGLFRLTGIPVFAYGVAPGDLVEAVREPDGLLWVTRVVQPGDHWVSRVAPLRPELRDAVAMSSLGAPFVAFGCRVHPTSYGLLAVDVPATVGWREVLDVLEQGRSRGDWDFDLGVDPARGLGSRG